MSWKEVAGAGLLLFGIGAAFIDHDKQKDVSESPKITCSIEYTPYETERRENPELEVTSDDELVQSGEEGQTRVCEDEGGTQVSSTVVEPPVNEVIEYGTKQPEPEYTATYTKPSSGVRTGAECNDGSYSSATGRGACSHHGGVSTWLYE